MSRGWVPFQHREGAIIFCCLSTIAAIWSMASTKCHACIHDAVMPALHADAYQRATAVTSSFEVQRRRAPPPSEIDRPPCRRRSTCADQRAELAASSRAASGARTRSEA